MNIESMLIPMMESRNVICYPYRTALVHDIVIQINRTSDEGCALEKTLTEMANVDPDNHVVYTLCKLIEFPEIHVMCSDDTISIGMKLTKMEW